MNLASTPIISVIIAHSRPSIRATLDSLASQAAPPASFEVIVVGDAPEQATSNGYEFALRYLRCADRNPSVRRNLGAQAAQGEILAFIDDDAMAANDWLEAAHRIFSTRPEVGVIGGPTRLPPGAPEMVAATYRAATEQHRAEIERLEAERGELKKQMESIADPAARLDAQNRLAEIDHLLRGLRKHVIEESQVADALRQLDPLWDELFPAEQARIVQLLIERVVLNEDGIQVRFRPDGMNALAAELEEKECIND
jgi:glycosyltransferase involved in cell wall biosynthesis